jgi:hypothetical protein
MELFLGTRRSYYRISLNLPSFGKSNFFGELETIRKSVRKSFFGIRKQGYTELQCSITEN